jgi:hypothetical protein
MAETTTKVSELAVEVLVEEFRNRLTATGQAMALCRLLQAAEVRLVIFRPDGTSHVVDTDKCDYGHNRYSSKKYLLLTPHPPIVPYFSEE